MEVDQNVNNSRPLEVCPQCSGQIDSGRPRLVVDSCGHKKCRLCLILDELGCSLCNDARKAATYDDFMQSPRKRSPKSHSTVNEVPVVSEEPCDVAGTENFTLSSVIKFSEFDGDGDLAECKLSLLAKTEEQIDKADVNGSSELNSCNDNVRQEQVSGLRTEYLAGLGLQKCVNKDGIVCKSSDQDVQVCMNGQDALSQKQPQLVNPPAKHQEEYFSDIETNPEYGTTDTLDAALLTQDCPIVNKVQPVDKPPGNTKQTRKKPSKNDAPHIKIVPGSPVKYFCTICSKYLLNKRQRNYHSFCGGNKTKPFQCMLCSKSFVGKNHYEYHIRTHAGFRPFSCEICGKSFYEKVKMIRHMMVHTGERPFKCKECGKTFVEACHLKYHLNTHSKEKIHLCAHCGRQFSLLLNLKRHELKHEDKQVMCELCGKVLRNNWALILHNKIHSRIRPHKCPVCSRTFIYRKDMKRHHNIHTSTRNYRCSSCEVVFTRKDGLVRHIKSIHQDGCKNKKSGKTTVVENSEATNKPDSVAATRGEEYCEEVENQEARADVAIPQHGPKSLEELLDQPTYGFEMDVESGAEVKLPKCGRIKGLKNRASAEEKKNGDEEKIQKEKVPRPNPIFRQIIYSKSQVNGNFKQIPVLLKQDKTVRCKEVPVISRPAGNIEIKVTKSQDAQSVQSTSSQCIIHHTSTLSTPASTTVLVSSSTPLTAIQIHGVTINAIQQPPVLPQKRRYSCEKSVAKPTVVQKVRKPFDPVLEKCVRTITRVPEGQSKPLVLLNQSVGAAAEPVRETVVSGSNVIQSCGQPVTAKTVHDVHWKKRSIEIAMKEKSATTRETLSSFNSRRGGIYKSTTWSRATSTTLLRSDRASKPQT